MTSIRNSNTAPIAQGVSSDASLRSGAPSEGFTLVEILVTIAVITFGCLAALIMQSAALKGNTRSDHLTVATFLAESEIERLKSISFDDLTAEIDPGNTLVSTSSTKRMNRFMKECTGVELPACVNYPYTMTTNFYPRYPTNSTHQAVVTVAWNESIGPQSIVYSTAVTDLAL
jgi:prepilin-type N-terminal cleavage/methylation domain-containing protein